MQGPDVGTRVRRKPCAEAVQSHPKGPTNAALDSYHRVRLSPWPSEPVCRRGKSPDLRLMGLRDWFFAVAATTGGCNGTTTMSAPSPNPISIPSSPFPAYRAPAHTPQLAPGGPRKQQDSWEGWDLCTRAGTQGSSHLQPVFLCSQPDPCGHR